MMKTVVKLAVFAFLYVTGISAVYRRCTRHRLRILCYHRISPKSDDPLLDVPVKRFRAQMQHLKRHYMPVALEYGLEHLKPQAPQNMLPPVSVTFDDGTTDWLTLALPALEEYQVPATFFVCTSYIGKGTIPYPNRHTPATALNRRELRQIAASPFASIGGHTLHHPQLSTLPASMAKKEIEGSRTILASWVQKEIALFAYPFGDDADYTTETMELARDAGHIAACTLDERTCRPSDDRYALPRLVIFDEPLWMFKVRVSGIVDDMLSLLRTTRHIRRGAKRKQADMDLIPPLHAPTVSIIIRTKDNEEMLKNALESVAEQTFEEWEALILDDSEAGSASTIARSFSRTDKRFLCIHNKPPLGKVRNLNYGLSLARGNYIAILDGDDYWYDSEKLARQVALMRCNPRIKVSAGGVVKLDVTGRGRTHAVPNVWRTDRAIRRAIMIENMIPHSALMFRKRDALMVGGYEERFPLSEDFDFVLKLGRMGAFHMDDRTYCHYHLHHDNATDRQKILQLLSTLRILFRHARSYPYALRGIFHVSLRLIISLFPFALKHKLAKLTSYRLRRYRYMARLVEK